MEIKDRYCANKMVAVVCEDDYYGPLLQKYVELIINSGMLLDEDLEVLANIFEFNTSDDLKSSDPPYGLLAASASLIGSSILVMFFNASSWYLIPPALTTTALALQEVSYRIKKQRHYSMINQLIADLRDLAKILERIYRYFQSRRKVSDRYDGDFFKCYDKHVCNFMKYLIQSQLGLNQLYLDNMVEISKFCDMLAEDCQNYMIPTSTDFTKVMEDVDMDTCFSTIEKFEKIQVLVNSKLLGYLGVIFCDKTCDLNKTNLDLFLNHRIPNIIKHTKCQCNYLNSLFNKLKKSVHLTRQKIQTVTSNKNFISTKLNIALENTLYNLCFLTEKAHNVMEDIDKQNKTDIEKISKGLIDLRKQTYSVFESLDLLCNLYGILAVRENQIEKIERKQPAAVTSQAPEKKIETINFDDEIELLDEHYELYLDKQFTDFQPEFYYDEKSDNQTDLLLQELRQALNNHERFIEARRKRENLEPDKNKPEPPPRKSKINVPGGEKVKTMTTEGSKQNIDLPSPPLMSNDEKVKTMAVEESQKSSKEKVPLPPPMPVLNLDRENISSRSELLQGIKLLASQFNNKEETYGAYASSSDDD